MIDHRAVFLDRDGVINRAFVRSGKPYPPTDVSELEILPGVEDALASLHEAGFLLVVVTNQPDVARGTVSRECVEAINATLADALPLVDIRTCYHDTRDECECRKPRPGAILASAVDYGIDLRLSYMVGDRWKDIEAGRQAGCKTIFLDYGYDEKQPECYDRRVVNLSEAARFILEEDAG